MSRAEDEALKEYPLQMNKFQSGFGMLTFDKNREARDAFIKGYEQSITWQDVQQIIQISNRKMNSLDYEQIEKLGEEGYYTKILNEFKGQKQK